MVSRGAARRHAVVDRAPSRDLAVQLRRLNELAPEGILVYEVRPGIIRTDMTSAATAKYDKMIAEGLTPIRRWGEPQDVGRAVAALARGELPFSTAEVINVDGGFHCRRL